MCAVFRDIKLNLYLASRPPKPSSTAPFSRDPDFVDRGDLLSRVDERCSQLAGRAALVGLGGVGKSQLAIEYTHRTRKRSPDTWVFWVHASNVARFEQGYQDIADLVKIAGRKDPKADIFKLVHDWLRGCEGKWLLILDNVDNTDLLSEAGDAGQRGQGISVDGERRQPISAYLPQSQNGSILVTSRSKGVALKLVEEKDIVVMQPMAPSQALALFEKKLGPLGQSDDTAELAAALEFMPLAIVQAAAYISQRAPRCSVQQYLENFRKSDRKKTSLLNYEGGQLRRDWQAQNSIIITWQISFEHIHRTWPSAADLLSLMSFFDRQGIPEALVRNRAASEHSHGSLEENDKHTDGEGTREREGEREEEEKEEDEEDEEDKDSVSGCSEDNGFEDDVQTLRNYSFLSVGTDRTFEMHALVQLAMRKWLEAHGQLEAWKQHYIKNLFAEFPTGEHENWTYCQALFPHAKSAVTQRPKGDGSLREWASLIYNAAWYAWRKGSIIEAVHLSEMGMEVRKKLFGLEHNETLSSMGLVGLAYSLGGRWKEAEELGIQVVETSQRVLGKEHPNTLSSMANLALTYWNQGRWKEAEELEIQVMETSQRVLGKEHPDTLTSMANLASTYRNQGRWKEAKELEIQVMETRQKMLGKEHPSTLTSMANLASTYRNQGRWKEAEELEIQVMETSQRVLGKEHPDTLSSMANLALTYWNQGRWKEAEELEIQVMETSQRVLGKEHPNTLTNMANLASTYWNQGRWKEAEELGIQVMETSQRVLGKEHPDTLTSMANLASTYRNQGHWKEAEELGIQVMKTRQKVLGKEHPNTLSSIANLASTYWNQGCWKEVKELEIQVMETRQRVLGKEHPDTLSSMANLASTYWNQGHWKEAKELGIQVMETSQRVLGKEHPDTLTSMANLAFTLMSQIRHEEAISLMESCFELQKRILGPKHPDTESSLQALHEWESEADEHEHSD